MVETPPGPLDTRMAEAVPFEKISPANAAAAIIEGIEAGDEKIFPDPMSRQLGSAYVAGPKELERQMAAQTA